MIHDVPSGANEPTSSSPARAPIEAKSFLRWLFTLALGVVAFGGCVLLLSDSVLRATADVKTYARQDSAPVVYGAVDVVPTGSITAIAPLAVAASIAPAPPAADAPTQTAPEVQEFWRVTTGVSVRARASKNSARVASLEGGDLVAVTARERNWMLVLAEDGVRGWVYGNFLVRDEGPER
jgi:hypothetical protein